MTLSRARVSSRSRAPRVTPKTRLSTASPAAMIAVRVIRSAAACWSGALPSPFRTSDRNAMVAGGSVLAISRESLDRSMSVPVIRARLGVGRPRTPGTVRMGMITNMPPAGSAGVRATIPATRTRTGPISSCDVSWTVPVPRAAAADGEASTGMTVAALTGVGQVGRGGERIRGPERASRVARADDRGDEQADRAVGGSQREPGAGVQRVSRRGPLSDRHAQDARRDRGARDPPGDDLDVAGQLITVDHLKFGVVSDRQPRRPGADIMRRGGQPAPAARGERHRAARPPARLLVAADRSSSFRAGCPVKASVNVFQLALTPSDVPSGPSRLS